MTCERVLIFFFFFQAEDGIRDVAVTGVQTCALPISPESRLAMDVAVAHRLHLPASSRKHRQRYLPHYLCAGGGGFFVPRSGERRGGEEGRSRGAPDHLKKKKKIKHSETRRGNTENTR